MTSFDKLYTIFWVLLATVIVTITVAVAIVIVTDSNNITRLVLNGITPVDAYCAIKSETTTARCLVSTIGANRD